MKDMLGRKLAEQGCGMAMEQFRLLAKGSFLVDDAIVRECQIVKGSKLLLMGRGTADYDDDASETAVTQEVPVSLGNAEADADAAASLDVIREWEDTENGPVDR